MNWISDKERQRTIRVVELLRQGYLYKQIIFLVGCSTGYINNVKYRYLKREVIWTLKPEGEALLNGDQLQLPIKRRFRQESQRAKMLRQLRKR
jgi:transposase